MLRLRLRSRTGLAAALVTAALVVGAPVLPAAAARPSRPAGRYVVRASTAADLAALRAQLRAAGAEVDDDLGPVQGLVVDLSGPAADALAGNARVATLARATVRTLDRPDGAPPTARSAVHPTLARRSLGADPA